MILLRSRSLTILAVACFVFAGLQLAPVSARAAEPVAVSLDTCPTFDTLLASPEAARQVWTDRLSQASLCLYMASSALAKTDLAKAIDLFALARIRSGYDFARCQTWPHGPTSSAMAAMRMTSEGALAEAGAKTVLPHLIATARLDSTYDYDFAELETMCDGGPLKPKSAWKAERDGIQSSAEAMSKTPG